MKVFKSYLKIFNLVAKTRLENADLDQRRIHAHLVVVLSTGLLMWAYAFLGQFRALSEFSVPRFIFYRLFYSASLLTLL
jgi:hypothetical protein